MTAGGRCNDVAAAGGECVPLPNEIASSLTLLAMTHGEGRAPRNDYEGNVPRRGPQKKKALTTAPLYLTAA